MSPHRLAFGGVLVAYLVVGSLYATRTPLWQAPDEPAHYNYIAHIVDEGPDPPEMEPGDYPAAYLEQLKAKGFPDGMSVAGIEYEDYQPPAYYYVASVVGLLAGGDVADRVHAVRLLGVLLGAVTVWLAWRVSLVAVPDDERLAVAAAGFVAFLPMHLTMTSSVNNDALAYAVSAALIWAAVSRAALRLNGTRFAIVSGLLLGLALLTKVSVYPAAALVAAAEITVWWRDGRTGGKTVARRLVVAFAIALAIGLPWFVRNALVYGAGDLLGTAAHNQVVVGQARTADWIAEHGVAGFARRFAVFTFDSFWGVFGWLGVFLDQRIYLALAAVSLAAAAGLARFGVALRRADDEAASRQRTSLALLLLAVAMTAALYLAYNLTFVQHQGRYLFPALVPIAILFCLGIREWPRWLASRLSLPKRGGMAGEALVLYAFVVAMAALAVVSLERFIVPGLG